MTLPIHVSLNAENGNPVSAGVHLPWVEHVSTVTADPMAKSPSSTSNPPVTTNFLSAIQANPRLP